MWDVTRLYWNRKSIWLLVLMVLLPAAIFTVLIARAVRSERTQVAHEKAERQRQIVRLVEEDLKSWLFSTDVASAISRALFRFEVEGDRVVFPDFQLSLPSSESPRRFPFSPATPGGPPTAQSIAESYYPRIVVFLRDFKSGAQYFLRLKVLVVRLPGRDQGYVLEAQPVLDRVNQRLTGLCAAAGCSARLWIGDFRDNVSLPATDAFGLEGFSFFQVVFYEPRSAGALDVRQHAFVYAMGLLVLITILGSLLVYRAVSQEARLSQLRTDFVSAVSHEFRSPLSSIMALSERLESARVRDPQQLAEYHHVVGQESRRLSALVSRLLDFAQIEGGRRVYSFERVDLVSVARDAIESCQYTVRPGRIRLCGAEAAPLWARADRTALQHCIQNLIENAVKYSPVDASVTVTCASANGSTVVEVQDRGIGVPLAEQEKIFEKFYRGRQAADLNVQGVGIGLALVKHVIDGHGGSVSVESRPGEGSCFRLRLPRAEG
ncbi:MAG: HAMP domain-containing histidine kinase [Acidobacteria bacterium]|nr:HAMP domain-containing histidine kinase [Acidobacteriota bacterium]